MATAKRFSFLTLIILSIHLNLSHGQTNEAGFLPYAKETIVHDIKHGFTLGLAIIQAPVHFDASDWTNTFLIAASTSVLLAADPPVKEYLQSNRSGIKDRLFKFDGYFDGDFAAPATAAIYLAGFFSREEKIRLSGLYLIETLYISSRITGFLKYAFGRRRPWAGDNHLDFKLFRGGRAKFSSFPSGHTTTAVAFGSVMAMSWDNTAWQVLWYSSAVLVGVSRMYNNNHWLTDTVFAAAVTHCVARYVVNFNNEADEENRSKRNFSLYAGPGHLGIAFHL